MRVAEAYGLPARRIEGADFEAALTDLLRQDGPAVGDVQLDPDQVFEPRLSARPLPDGRIVSPPLEDLNPFLEREELLSNLFIPPME